MCRASVRWCVVCECVYEKALERKRDGEVRDREMSYILEIEQSRNEEMAESCVSAQKIAEK